MTTKHSPPWHVYLINLDRSPDRLDYQKKQLGALNLPFTRVPAIDGDELGEELPNFDNRAYDFRHGKSANPNEVGCYLSHYRAIEIFMASDNEFALILEDDAQISEDTIPVINTLLRNAVQWDVVNLGGRRNGMPVNQKKLTDKHFLVAYLFRQTGAAAYLINRHAGRQYLEKLLPMKVPFDHEFDRAWIYKIKYRGVQPRLVTGTATRQTTIGYKEYQVDTKQGAASYSTKKPQWKRGSVLLYRGWNEITRIVHYTIRGLFIPRA